MLADLEEKHSLIPLVERNSKKTFLNLSNVFIALINIILTEKLYIEYIILATVTIVAIY